MIEGKQINGGKINKNGDFVLMNVFNVENFFRIFWILLVFYGDYLRREMYCVIYTFFGWWGKCCEMIAISNMKEIVE